MEDPKAYMKDEVQEKFLEAILDNIEYWTENSGGREETKGQVREALKGFAFSMMVTMDGYSGLPKFILAPDPHEDDKEFHIKNGERYFPENDSECVVSDISGNLQDVFREMETKRRKSV